MQISPNIHIIYDKLRTHTQNNCRKRCEVSWAIKPASIKLKRPEILSVVPLHEVQIKK